MSTNERSNAANVITAVIPVRAGSRRMKNKNIASFNGTTLLEHKIEVLKRVPEISRIVVSSDSEYMLALAEAHGALTHKRPIEYCDEQTKTFGEVVRFVCSSVEGDHILWTPCTCPLIYPKLYSQAISCYWKVRNDGYDSLMSVEPLKRYLWDETGPINYELGLKHVPSQQLPNLYIVTNGILLAPREKMIEWAYFFGPHPYKFVLDKLTSVDIDDELDLIHAQAWFERNRDKFDPF